MALKKSQLYSSIWKACDELRGGMDASQYKDYVLVLLFVRYVSDKYGGKKNQQVEVPKGGSFADLVALKGKKNIGEGINTVLKALAKANGLEGVIDDVDFDDPNKLGDGQAMVDRLTKLVGIFENPDLNFGKNRAEGDDLLGDAYEYLMKHFAVESGKSKGQFYTPAEVSRIIAKLIDAKHAKSATPTVYDPACGSGSLLLKVADESPKIAIHGQELDNATASLATLNMWLHDRSTAIIQKGKSTLSDPLFTDGTKLKTFDYVVANPPFSFKSWRTGFHDAPEEDRYGRFEGFGIPPEKNGDFAFLLHIIKSLKSTGVGAVVLPHGVLFRGNAEGDIRRNIVDRGYIKAIVGLPANLFYGTGIPACIIVINRSDAATRKGIFMIDASKGFTKDGSKNRLRERDIRKVVDAWNGKQELPKFSRLVLLEEIQKNNYNLNLPRYIDTQESEDIQDIEAHLKGGIPEADVDALAGYWEVCPTLKADLFKASRRKGYMEPVLAPDAIKKAVLEHPEFSAFRKGIMRTFGAWCMSTTAYLKGITEKDHPKAIIQKIADDLLQACGGLRLVDSYDLYQHLMQYWEDTMQDDAHTITVDGWKAGNEVVRLLKISKKGKRAVAGLKGLEGRLLPTSLIVKSYFAREQISLDELLEESETIAARIEEHETEFGDGDDADENEETEIVRGVISDLEKQAKAKMKEVMKAEADLEKKVLAKYPMLTVDEIKTLVVERKWMDELAGHIVGEVEHVSHLLTGRVKELVHRYSEPMRVLEGDVVELRKKVATHLVEMGFEVR
jgi:type I restriction enzyme M protein